MIPQAIKHTARHILVIYLIALCVPAFSAIEEDGRSHSLDSIYTRAIQYYKNDSLNKAISILNSFFEANDFKEFNAEYKGKQYENILNDYAFLLYEYYLEQIPAACKEINDEVGLKPVIILRSQLLDKSELLLLFVLQLNQQRAVAHLNLADVMYQLNKEIEAEKHYKEYVSLMIKEGKKKKIPKRAIDQSIRKKYYLCN